MASLISQHSHLLSHLRIYCGQCNWVRRSLCGSNTAPYYRTFLMNKKEIKIKQLWERGVRDPSVIAKKLGYTGSAITAAIEKILLFIKDNKLN